MDDRNSEAKISYLIGDPNRSGGSLIETENPSLAQYIGYYRAYKVVIDGEGEDTPEMRRIFSTQSILHIREVDPHKIIANANERLGNIISTTAESYYSILDAIHKMVTLKSSANLYHLAATHNSQIRDKKPVLHPELFTQIGEIFATAAEAARYLKSPREIHELFSQKLATIERELLPAQPGPKVDGAANERGGDQPGKQKT